VRIFVSVFLALMLADRPKIEEKRMDPSVLEGKTIDDALEILGVGWDKVEMRDEPPGVFAFIVIPLKYARTIENENGKRLLTLIPNQRKQMFSEKRKWDRSVVGKLVIRESLLQ